MIINILPRNNIFKNIHPRNNIYEEEYLCNTQNGLYSDNLKKIKHLEICCFYVTG